MPAGSPLRGGSHHTEDFPPLPSRTNTSTVVQPSHIKPTYVESTRTKPFVPVSNLPLLPDVAIKSPIVMDKDGIKAVIFQQEEVEASMQAYRYALVARFHGERPSVDTFERHVNSEWGLMKPAVVGLLNPRHIMLRMDSERDFTHAWVREANSFNNFYFTLYKWSEGVLQNKVRKRAVWVELQKLPVMYQLPSMLEQIANNIGRFLRLDERTRAGKHPIAPRLCVELDFNAPLPTEVWVGYTTPDGKHVGFPQPITYDLHYSKCNHCKSMGHELPLCPQRNVMPVAAFKRRHTQRDTEKQKEEVPGLQAGRKPQYWREKAHSKAVDKPPQMKQFVSQSSQDNIIYSLDIVKDNTNRDPLNGNLDPGHIPLVLAKNKTPCGPAESFNGHKDHLVPRPKPSVPQQKPTTPISNQFQCLLDTQLQEQRKTSEEEDNGAALRAVHNPLSSQGMQDQSRYDQPNIPIITQDTISNHAEPSSSKATMVPHVLKEQEEPYESLKQNYSRAQETNPRANQEQSDLDRDEAIHEPNTNHAEPSFSKVLHVPNEQKECPATVSKKEIRNTVSWIEGDIQSVHIFENDLEDNIEESMLKHSDFDEFTRHQEVTPIKILQDSSQKQVETLDSTDHESDETAQSHMKVYSRARRAEGNSFGRIKPGIKWADVIDSEEEK